MNKKFVTSIKVTSTILIASAIGLELGNIYPVFDNKISTQLQPIFWLERFALISHLIEAAIAASYASSRNKTPISYAIYTFFVGTVALLELFDKTKEPSSQS
jgi:hypothetical protein